MSAPTACALDCALDCTPIACVLDCALDCTPIAWTRIAGRRMGTARLRRQDKRSASLALEFALALAGRAEHLKTNEGKDSFEITLAVGRHDYRVSDITATSAKIDVTRPTYDSSSRQLSHELVMSYVVTFGA